MNTPATGAPATVIAYISAADARISYGISEGQLVKYFHDRPESTIVDFAQATAATFLGAGAPGVICVSPIAIAVDGSYTINADALFYPEGAPVLDQFVTLMKLQILEDMRANLVPRDVATFSELHDHVDANEYGGFTCDSVTSRLRSHYGDDFHNNGGFTTFFNTVQDHVDMWLRERARTPDEDGEAALARDMLVDAYEAFASAALRLSTCIDAVDGEGEACAANYPFAADFESVVLGILHWQETNITRLAPDSHYVATGADRIARVGEFGIDGLVNNIAGYTYGDTWNGWQCPMFTKANGDVIAAAINSDITAGVTLLYEADIDAFVDISEGERTEYKGEDVRLSDGVVHVYAIGAFGWTWDRSENVGGVPGEDAQEPPMPEQRACACTDGFSNPRPNCPDCNGTGFVKTEVRS